MRTSALLTALVLALSTATGAQSKPPLKRSDYGQFESIAPGAARGGFSADGAWMAVSVSRSSRNNELRLIKLADGTTKTVPSGAQVSYTTDSKWAGYSIGFTETEQERMRAARQPIQNKFGLISLSSGEQTTFDGVQQFSFSGDGKFVAMKRYPPAPAGGAAAAPAAPPEGGRGGGPGGAATDNETQAIGTTLIVRELATAKDTTFGNVADFAWQNGDAAHLLAMSISADGQTGNGLHLFDPSTTVLRVLDSAAAAYTNLSWREKSADLAALKSKTDDKREGPAQIVLSWRGLGGASEKRLDFDPTAAGSGVAAGLRTVSFRRPSWSKDGGIIFVGLANWKDKPPAPPGRGGGRGANASPDANTAGAEAAPGGTASTTGRGRAAGAAADEVDEPAAVDVWHWKDTTVMSAQKLQVAGDRRRNHLAAWHLGPNKLVQLGKSFSESVAPIPGTTLAYLEEWKEYAMDRSIGRRAADLYLVDMLTGDRTKLKDKVDDAFAQLSPAGKYVLFLQDDQFWTIDLKTKAVTNLTKAVPAVFIEKESDATVKQKPSFGIAGWTKDDTAVLINDKFDVWQVPVDGSKATRLTNGATEEIRHRITRVSTDEDFIDVSKPQFVSLFGIWSKKSGYGTLANGAVTRLLFEDKAVGSLAKAEKADAYSYVVQNHDDSPDIFVASSASLTGAKQVTTTNPFQDNFAWSKSEVVDFKTDKGLRLQGALYYPAGYEAGKRYPMIVYIYEKLSDGVHRYVVPSDRDYYNTTVFTSQGYFVFQPDIVFRPREPGLSVVECVTAGVKKVATMGVIDPAKVGVIGHSWGGFDTAFLATHTQGVFAAAVAGAAITDLVSNYGNGHWSSGIAETDHIETGQQRMEVPLYEDLQAYIRNSAVFNIQNMTVPLMLEAGDVDGTVFWHQAVEMYNIARRAKKNVVMVVYNGEDHGLRLKKNQVDYQRRILEWFGHYLKGDKALPWITEGVPALK